MTIPPIPQTTLQIPLPPMPANASPAEKDRLVTAHVRRLNAAIDALALPPLAPDEMRVEPIRSQQDDLDDDFLALMIRSARMTRVLEVAASNYRSDPVAHAHCENAWRVWTLWHPDRQPRPAMTPMGHA